MNEQVSYPLSRLDRISGLPDGIICTILSRLPVEESARTTILSKRWCKIWALSPITISDESILKQSHTYSSTQECSTYSSWLINTLSHIISTHLGPIHTCHFILPTWHDHPQTLVKLLKTLTLKGIQNLKIYGNSCVFSIPGFVLECESLVDVDFRHVSIHDPSRPDAEMFPNLRKLTLFACNVFFVSILSSKSIIELNLSCTDDEEVVIESHSLQKLSFSNEDYTKLVIEDVPNLESFSYSNLTRNSEVVILDAPKLKVLSCIDMHISMLQLESYRFRFYEKYMKISGEIAQMPSLRSLDIIVDINHGHEANAVPLILKCFPCLEILKIMIIDEGENNTGSGSDSADSADDEYDDNEDDDDNLLVVNGYTNYDHLTSNINCLNHHLKVLRIENYSGTASHSDLANLVIAKAKVLETASLVYGNHFDHNLIEEQTEFLMQTAASEMLRVEFAKKSEV